MTKLEFVTPHTYQLLCITTRILNILVVFKRNITSNKITNSMVFCEESLILDTDKVFQL